MADYALVVEDDGTWRDIFVRAAERIGLEHESASTTQRALELIGRHSYSLVLLDADLGTVLGAYGCTEILAELKARHAEVPVIIVSGIWDTEQLIRELRAQYRHLRSFSKSRGLVELDALISEACAVVKPTVQPLAANVRQSSPEAKLGSSRVFIVHGQNHDLRDKIDLFLTKELKLQTAIMEAGAHTGRTLPEKFEETAQHCSFAIFILTADDVLLDVVSNKNIRRARQNVVLEVGYFWGRLGRRGNVAFLVETHQDMELPSDIQGLGLIPLTSDLAETKLRLVRELKAAGLVES